MTENFKERTRVFSYICIIITFCIALAIAARLVIIPLSISILFAIVLNPALRRLERLKIPRILAISLILVAFIIVLGGIITFCGYQLTQLLKDLPALRERIFELIAGLGQQLEQRFNISPPQQDRWLSNLMDNTGTVLAGVWQSTSYVLTMLLQIPIYIFLILLYKHKWRKFLVEIFKGERKVAASRMDEVKGVVQSYITGLFIVICILAVLNSLGLLLLGIRYAVFFGIFSALLTVIPYIGNFIGGLFPFLVALVTKDSAWYAAGVVIVYAVIQFVEGNFITPNIMGARVSINPLVALLSLIVGGQILGLAGLILAIPIVAILKIAIAKSRTLSPLVILMEESKED